MHDFHAITKNIKNNIRKIDRCISSDVTTLRTSSYVLNQAQEQEKLFAKTLSKAVDMCTKNVVVAAKLSIMREVFVGTIRCNEATLKLLYITS